MASKVRRRSFVAAPDSVNNRIAINDRIAALHREISAVRRARASVSRHEFKEVVRSLRQIHENTEGIAEHTHHLATQITRMAQMQVEIDAMHRALKRAGLVD